MRENISVHLHDPPMETAIPAASLLKNQGSTLLFPKLTCHKRTMPPNRTALLPRLPGHNLCALYVDSPSTQRHRNVNFPFSDTVTVVWLRKSPPISSWANSAGLTVDIFFDKNIIRHPLTNCWYFLSSCPQTGLRVTFCCYSFSCIS